MNCWNVSVSSSLWENLLLRMENMKFFLCINHNLWERCLITKSVQLLHGGPWSVRAHIVMEQNWATWSSLFLFYIRHVRSSEGFFWLLFFQLIIFKTEPDLPVDSFSSPGQIFSNRLCIVLTLTKLLPNSKLMFC